MKVEIAYRQQIKPSDASEIGKIVRSSGFFSQEEIDLAIELADDKLQHGAASSYQFLFAEEKKTVLGYTCYGLIPATAGSYDLYWIAVDEKMRGQGLGRKLLQRTEDLIRAAAGRNIYIETSSRSQYQPTHVFYEKCGYHKEAFLKEFYAQGDGKVIYSKSI
ncbi:MAG TPA: GNAT family N-acetyltransferase [Smithellaceae bacterium]|nr:GNAT family N-acetyltransferase [Smithellaceae bacterium]